MVEGFRRGRRLIFAAIAAIAALAPHTGHAADTGCPDAIEFPRPPFPPNENPLDEGPVPLLVVIANDSARADALQHQAFERLGTRGTLVNQTDRPSCWITSRRCFIDVPSGPAAKTLPELSRQLGLRGFLRTRGLATVKTPQVRGCYSVASAFSMMFSGTPVSFELADDVLTVTPGHPDPSTTYFDVPAGDAATVLPRWTHQAGLQLLFKYPDVKGHETGPLQGYFHPDQGLQALLAGTPLMFDRENKDTLAILLRPTPHNLATDHRSWWRRWIKMKAQPVETAAKSLEEIVIASDLDDWKDSLTAGAPLTMVTRTDIDATGLTTVPDLTRTLPQVWGGGPTDHTELGREAMMNATYGTGFNLRGLDAGATLVLVDGQRLAGSGTAAEYVDISNIPLSAIDHIDISADGSSTRYGADAVAGVVNFVTRKDFNGFEVEGVGGEASGAVRGQVRLNGIFGKHWDGGRAMMALEFDQQHALPASARAQATSDLTPFGGQNFDTSYGDPGTLVIGSQTWAIPKFNGTTPTVSTLQPGTRNLYDEFAGSDMLPDQRRLSFVTTLSQSVGEDSEIWFHSWLSRREVTGTATAAQTQLSVPANNPFYLNPTGGTETITVLYSFGPAFAETGRIGVSAGSATFGLRLGVGGWKLGTSLGYSFERTSDFVENALNFTALNDALSSSDPLTSFDPFGSRTNAGVLRKILATYTLHLSSSTEMFNLTADRELLRLRGGSLSVSTGAEYRQELFDTAYGPDYVTSPGYLADYERHATAGFAEIRVPLIGESNRSLLAQRLEVSVGGRYEEYEQFGGAIAPKVGALWTPASWLSLRGTWGKGFRPPAMTDLDESHNQSGFAVLRDTQSLIGTTTTLYWLGGNTDLHLERSTTWTVGADFTPVPELSIGVTYFDVVDRGRIDKLLLTADSLTDPTFLGSTIWNPTLNQRQAVCEHSTFYGAPGGCLSAPISAIIDLRAQNLDLLQTRGLDLSGHYQLDSTRGQFDLGIDATYLLEYSQARGSNTPPLELLNLQHEPIDWRARGKISWKLGPIATAAFVNFTNSYRDTASSPSRTVKSWTTVDFGIEYTPGEGWLKGTTFGFNAQNLFDAAPPFLNNVAMELGYDQENASLLGRDLSVQVRHHW